MPFWDFKPGRDDSFRSRLERARQEGFRTGAREGKLFKLGAGKEFDRQRAMDWLDAAIESGRVELEDQHAWEREIETWDMCCRIAFLLEIVT
jgi:hypothetical protein